MTLGLKSVWNGDAIPKALLVLLVTVISVWVASQFVVNANDTDVHRAFIEAVFSGGDGYQDSTYFGPPHAAWLLIPWVLFDERIVAFCNLWCILLFLAWTPHRIRWHVLFYAVSPLLLFTNASANVTGITTGIGLILVFGQSRGLLRGYAWAMLAVKPQEAGIILAIDGLWGLYQRDYWAILTGFLLCLPSLIWLPNWLAALEYWNVAEQHRALLSPSGRYPWWVLGLISAAILSWLYWRRIALWQHREQGLWLANMLGWLWINPYLQLYTLWIVLIPLRWLKAQWAILLWGITLALMLFFVSDYQPERWIHGVMGLLLVWIIAGLATIGPATATPIVHLSEEQHDVI